MSLEENKALVRKLYIESINGKDKAILDQIMSADVQSDTAFPDPGGLAGYKQVFDEVIGAFPDYEIRIEEEIAEGDQVVTRYTARGTHEGDFLGMAPTGRRIELKGIDINRVSEGKIVEHSSEASVGVLLLELGFAPPS
ncbi:MAG TPA: ester cyclase [Solirubrobacteraceae bacterium]|jgi:predicted ester cyclase|nr:ester cyclase [Solirubrobacteraceae bacterium]